MQIDKRISCNVLEWDMPVSAHWPISFSRCTPVPKSQDTKPIPTGVFKKKGWKDKVVSHFKYLCQHDPLISNPNRRLLLLKDAIRNIYQWGKEDEEVNLEILPAESSPISTTAPTAPPSWITKLRKHELRAELNDRSVKYEKNDNKSVLVELLRLRLRCEVLLSGNNFLNTDEFRKLLVPFLPNDTLMAMRVVSKP